MFVLKEIEVHDGTVGGGVNFLLFLLASQDWDSDLGLAFLISYGGWKCDQEWIYSSWFLLGHVCSPNSCRLGRKIWQIGLEGW